MDKYEKFQADLKAQKEANYNELMSEIKSLSAKFEKLISLALNSTTAKAERESVELKGVIKENSAEITNCIYDSGLQSKLR